MVPFVGPREDDDARTSDTKGRPHLALQGRGLFLRPVPQAVHPDLREQDRPIVAQAVQPREVVLERLGRFQVHVEGREIKERQPEIFRRRIVHVRHEGVRILILRDPVQALDELLDAAPPVPSDDGRGDFVADAVAEDRRVSRARADPPPDPVLDLPDLARLVQEGHMFSPVQPDHDSQAVF